MVRGAHFASWRRRLWQIEDPRGLAAFRILFGAVMLLSVIRFVARGWVDTLYVAPGWHFTYLGFGWVTPWSRSGMYLHFAVMGIAASAVMVGARTRTSAAIFALAFTYVELIDKTLYLNHYYLVSLLALLLVVVPSGAAWSVDGWWRRRRGAAPLPVAGWAYALLRAQVAVVYIFAGLAKLNGDWLWRAEPLGTWLTAFGEIPLVGPLLVLGPTAAGMSWFGAFFDLTIVFWLRWKRTRRVAYAIAIVFHVTIWLLFPVGVFSWVMLASATLFFDPSWPAWMSRRARGESLGTVEPLQPMFRFVIALYVAIQVLLPMRCLLYPGSVLWTEQGFRFAWRVMLIEKTGRLYYEVFAEDERFVVYPRRRLPMHQHRMLSTQPDLIHEYALHLAQEFRDAGYDDVRVHAHAWASLNARASQRLIDPETDLAAEPRSWSAKAWVVPLRDDIAQRPAHARTADHL